MSTIYLVTSGSYSDYGLLGVYSTKAQAELAHMLFAADNDIEEWELDEMPDHPPGLFHYLVIQDRDGNSDIPELIGASEAPFKSAWAPWGQHPLNKKVSFRVWAEGPVHALKIANEIRAALIATGEWTTDYNEWRARQDLGNPHNPKVQS